MPLSGALPGASKLKSQPTVGDEVLWMFWIGFELVADLADKKIEGASGYRGSKSPHLTEEILPAMQLARCAHQVRCELKLQLGQLYPSLGRTDA